MLALAIAAAANVHAIERRPLPEFTLTDLQGNVVGSQTLHEATGKWLLVYVQPQCATCDTLLKSIDVTAHPDVPARLAIIVGRTSHTGAAALKAKYPALSAARWFADRDRSALEALKVPGWPAVFGVRGDHLEWSLIGVVPDVERVQSALVSWVGAQ